MLRQFHVCKRIDFIESLLEEIPFFGVPRLLAPVEPPIIESLAEDAALGLRKCLVDHQQQVVTLFSCVAEGTGSPIVLVTPFI